MTRARKHTHAQGLGAYGRTSSGPWAEKQCPHASLLKLSTKQVSVSGLGGKAITSSGCAWAHAQVAKHFEGCAATSDTVASEALPSPEALSATLTSTPYPPPRPAPPAAARWPVKTLPTRRRRRRWVGHHRRRYVRSVGTYRRSDRESKAGTEILGGPPPPTTPGGPDGPATGPAGLLASESSPQYTAWKIM